MDGDPFSAGRGTPSQRNVGKEILFYARTMTYRWRTASRPFAVGEVEGMDWIRWLQFVKPLLYCFLALGYRQFAVLGADPLGMRHRLDYLSWNRLSIRAIAYQLDKLQWLCTAKDDCPL